MLKWGISLKQLVVLQMLNRRVSAVGTDKTFSAGGLLLALVIAIVKLIVSVLVIACLKTAWRDCVFAPLTRDLGRFGFAFLAFVSLLAA